MQHVPFPRLEESSFRFLPPISIIICFFFNVKLQPSNSTSEHDRPGPWVRLDIGLDGNGRKRHFQSNSYCHRTTSQFLGVYLSNRLAGADPTVMLLATCGTIIILFAGNSSTFPWRNTQDQAHTTEHQNTQYELLIELVRAVLDKLASIEQLIAEQQPKPNSTPAGPEH
ncbi:hypothetical protein KEM48_006619 [Puccinia striiformis f. sp. tritici PST-130]|nr:hypothetical protein KEM48_006619 [Puccinia striiformis f. sp. tritici PST-130]